jgi:hypothetical protein
MDNKKFYFEFFKRRSFKGRFAFRAWDTKNPSGGLGEFGVIADIDATLKCDDGDNIIYDVVGTARIYDSYDYNAVSHWSGLTRFVRTLGAAVISAGNSNPFIVRSEPVDISACVHFSPGKRYRNEIKWPQEFYKVPKGVTFDNPDLNVISADFNYDF